MKKVLIIFSWYILISCEQKSNQETSSLITDNEISLELNETKNIEKIPTDIIQYFKDFKGTSIKIEVENFTQDQSFKPNDCLPLNYLIVLDNKIPQTQAESTGAKPVGKFKINDSNYFLVVVQQDDYGPIYYGLTYNSQEKKIQNSEKIAESWGDAGDSQVTYSLVTFNNDMIKIDKYIETCHADLEAQGDEMIATNVKCYDSTATIEITINIKP
jgi:hypothetical protein